MIIVLICSKLLSPYLIIFPYALKEFCGATKTEIGLVLVLVPCDMPSSLIVSSEGNTTCLILILLFKFSPEILTLFKRLSNFVVLVNMITPSYWLSLKFIGNVKIFWLLALSIFSNASILLHISLAFGSHL